eukprot:TRINITY_DN1622_c0_g4_i3.p1 TRINITY_DN1622_c0_g4~~TRINITY_DN1622_c0_g4_i3.p1  ORF type:complete len:317 (-),score=141.25 TRINITY_DN1622_c0_g4_i3:65-1015(-)
MKKFFGKSEKQSESVTSSNASSISVSSQSRYDAATESVLARLNSKHSSEWDCNEVATWLSTNGFDEYKQKFLQNYISGAELLDLTDADLIMLGVEKLGVRKRMFNSFKEIQNKQAIEVAEILAQRKEISIDSYDDDDDNTSQSSKHSSSYQSSRSYTDSSIYSVEKDEILVKSFFEDDIRILRVKSTINLNNLHEKITSEYRKAFIIKYKDEDGDLITLKTDEHLQIAFLTKPVKLFLFVDSTSRANTSVLKKNNKSTNNNNNNSTTITATTSRGAKIEKSDGANKGTNVLFTLSVALIPILLIFLILFKDSILTQ